MMRSTVNVEASQPFVQGPTLYIAGPNLYRLLCGICGEIWFVDASVFRRASRAIMGGLDNPFLCGNCDHEEEEVWRFAE